MSHDLIDLYSDTKTRPTPAMRRAIADAEVGDEQHFEDPTVATLIERVADLLGHQDGLFLPSGTMANEIAVLVHCRPGDEIVAHRDAHILNFEGGAPAALAGAMVKPLPGPNGMFDDKTFEDAIRPKKRHLPNSRLVVVEQTTNLGGGAIWPIERCETIAAIAHERDMKLHLDGARLFNAAVASGLPARRYARICDTVYVDFTKGLGAPFGAVLVGDGDTIEQAWRWKQRLGGSMRQAGMLAAGCLHALDHHVDRLAEDHDNAQRLATMLGEIDGITVEPVFTNMVYLDVAGLHRTAEDFAARLTLMGARMSVQGETRLRAVTHLGIDYPAIERVAELARRLARDTTPY